MTKQLKDMIPPWEEFPTYTRYTIGWRMGGGEQYRNDWREFINGLPKDYESRLTYLKRHRPAPLNWGDQVLSVLYPDSESDQEYGCSDAEINKLLELRLIEHDVAYQTWLSKQSGIKWPWLLVVSNTPEEAARYGTRDFWFFSRQFNAMRRAGNVDIEQVPKGWKSVETELLTGQLNEVDPSLGLLMLSKMLCAGTVQPPWTYGLFPEQCANSAEMDMGYCDAFCLWIVSAFDDDVLLQKMLQLTGIPNEWTNWIDEMTRGLFQQGRNHHQLDPE